MLLCCRQLDFGSESQIRCRTHISAVKANSLQTTRLRQRITNSLQNTHFDNECYFTADNSTSAANHKFVAEHTFRQRMLVRCRKLSFISESQIRNSQLNFGNESQIHCRTHISHLLFCSESQFCCRTHNSAANACSLQETQFRLRIANSQSQLNFGSESQIHCRTHISAANANSL